MGSRLGVWVVTAGLMAGTATAALGASVYEDVLHAVNNADEGTVAQLLAKGVDVNTVGPNGDSLLMIAARHGKPQMMKAILAARPRVNQRNGYGETALMMAAINGHVEAARQLLAQGAELNHGGWT